MTRIDLRQTQPDRRFALFASDDFGSGSTLNGHTADLGGTWATDGTWNISSGKIAGPTGGGGDTKVAILQAPLAMHDCELDGHVYLGYGESHLWVEG